MKHLLKKVALIVLISVLCVHAQVFGTTHHVPADYASIQAGLDASASGDTVLVQPGTYVENIDWPSVNSIKLIAAGDSSNTIIDERNVGRIQHPN